jgi:hypothetical protein
MKDKPPTQAEIVLALQRWNIFADEVELGSESGVRRRKLPSPEKARETLRQIRVELAQR